MPVISNPQQVAAIYEQAAARGLCLANFCTSNVYTTEAILRAAYEFGQQYQLAGVPVVVSATANYPIESQLVSYTSLRDAGLGMRALVDDVMRLAGQNSPYADLAVMLHLDHGQPEADDALFEWAAEFYATIMYDASDWPLELNIEMTRRFVERMRGRVLVEGAVAEIAQAVAHAADPLTTPEHA